MKQISRQIVATGSVYICCLIASFSATAQISSDTTLPNPSNVTQTGTSFEITGGTQLGSNLFHSFRDFTVPEGGEAFFHNTANVNNVTNIFSRVTGGSISHINGLIRENYGANFILINPSGINFGSQAQLRIGGSFLASTANSVKFADGAEFSASNSASPQLTISVPIGLQFGQNPQGIRVQGNGHNITLQSPIFSPFTIGDSTGLKVEPGKTLALVGGNINFEGGTVTAKGGRIDLGSVAGGLVSLDSNSQGWNLGYQGVTYFQDISLSQKALADTSGIGSGSIQLQGRNISIKDGSVVLIQTLGNESAGGINVKASDSLSLIGTTANGQISSNLFTETLGGGRSGNITVSTPNLLIQDGAAISAVTYTAAPGGNIEINTVDSVKVLGFSPVNPSRFSNITGATFGAGDAGRLTVSTQQLTALSGGSIASVTAGTGSGGNVTINAAKLVELIGVTPGVFTPSAVTAGTGGPGRAGSVTINTQRLVVKDGGRVDASTLASGTAGSVIINAEDAVEVSGTVPGSVNPSLIVSSANIVDESLQQLLRVPAVPSGDSGDVTINTRNLMVTDGAQLTVRNDGTGDAGTLRVNAGSILLNSAGTITADNKGAGSGGNLIIDTGKLTISDRSFLSASTFGDGTGGDINIRATDAVEIVGTGFAQMQGTFQVGALLGSLQPTDRGTGIFMSNAGAGSSGNLNLETSSLVMRNGAIIFNPTFTQGVGGDLNILATDFIQINGSAIQTGNVIGSTGTAGDIKVATKQLFLEDGGTFVSATFGNGQGGSIEINAADSIQIQRTPPGAALLTGIYTNTTFGTGQGGDIRIDTGNLFVEDGVIGSNTGSSLPPNIVIPLGGAGGDVIVNARESVEIAGVLPDPRFPSGLGTTGFSASRSGDLTINTKKLILRDGADASTATLGAGIGGTLTVNASESIELSGTTIGDLTLGGISAAAGRATLPELIATGASGDIRIFTDSLIVRDGAKIDVQSLGTGNAGNMQVVANSIFLDNQGAISAATTSGEGGNISLQTRSVLMRNNSQISATAGGTGNGGNIDITGFSPANFVALLEESKITADAVAGRGGNISINTRGFFVCPTCQISASSQLGIAGEISITTPEVESNFEVVDLPQQVAKPEQVVAQACRATTSQNRSEFTITGRGGLPPRPSEQLSSGALFSFEPAASAATEVQSTSQLPLPARGWYVNKQGVVVLASQSPNSSPYNSGLTSSNCQQ
ncbi:filamentous hemagglutinin N-terminal domain-containing protein [Tolypothrix sp. FACHB-123]|uniref:two-partner secretion domain-containing protein n=1 Tax=Tolypothrix sp. FACHB-123 TaxID=2692868 RepID=UPI0016851386|nr:filamentous hemagglutinin N-terminal domain-containing protein [Tolypothrix sp. FACHB-123]MBD2355346.1 filamentous hemagglutinin N-terminal domain-containing protein [Tolypothrix sp. FACHB-123]